MAVHHISKKTPRISIRGVLGQRIIAAQSAALAAPQLCGIAVAVDERRHFDDCAVVALGFGTQRETVVVAGNGRLICCHGHFGFLIHRETPFNKGKSHAHNFSCAEREHGNGKPPTAARPPGGGFRDFSFLRFHAGFFRGFSRPLIKHGERGEIE